MQAFSLAEVEKAYLDGITKLGKERKREVRKKK
jgi:hypothetical protein